MISLERSLSGARSVELIGKHNNNNNNYQGTKYQDNKYSIDKNAKAIIIASSEGAQK